MLHRSNYKHSDMGPIRLE